MRSIIIPVGYDLEYDSEMSSKTQDVTIRGASDGRVLKKATPLPKKKVR